VKIYEAMFLMEPVLATDWPAAEAEINRILERAGAKPLGMTNWGERKLAYPIGHRKRGVYALTYFEAMPEKISGIERDVQLSEKAVRVLVLRRDKMTVEEIQKSLAAEPPARIPLRGEEGDMRPRGPRGEGEGFGPARPPVGRAAPEAPVAPTPVAEEEIEGIDTFDPDAVEDSGPEQAP
jgi:small subunit ribosomal protein S6